MLRIDFCTGWLPFVPQLMGFQFFQDDSSWPDFGKPLLQSEPSYQGPRSYKEGSYRDTFVFCSWLLFFLFNSGIYKFGIICEMHIIGECSCVLLQHFKTSFPLPLLKNDTIKSHQHHLQTDVGFCGLWPTPHSLPTHPGSSQQFFLVSTLPCLLLFKPVFTDNMGFFFYTKEYSIMIAMHSFHEFPLPLRQCLKPTCGPQSPE